MNEQTDKKIAERAGEISRQEGFSLVGALSIARKELHIAFLVIVLGALFIAGCGGESSVAPSTSKQPTGNAIYSGGKFVFGYYSAMDPTEALCDPGPMYIAIIKTDGLQYVPITMIEPFAVAQKPLPPAGYDSKAVPLSVLIAPSSLPTLFMPELEVGQVWQCRFVPVSLSIDGMTATTADLRIFIDGQRYCDVHGAYIPELKTAIGQGFTR